MSNNSTFMLSGTRRDVKEGMGRPVKSRLMMPKIMSKFGAYFKRDGFTNPWFKQFKSILNAVLFPGIPEHYPLRKKILITRSSTAAGAWWDTIQIVMTVGICVIYVWGTFPISLETTKLFHLLELIMCQFFAMEIILNWYLVESSQYFLDPVTWVDLLSVAPVYASLALPADYTKDITLLQCFRVMRLVRIFKGFKLMRNITGVRRQVINLSVTLVSAMFLAAGLVQIIENNQAQSSANCLYINADTDWRPSCTESAPASEYCECAITNCRGLYMPSDQEGHMSAVTCVKLTFFDSFYYIVVTLSTVGYGHIVPTTVTSKLFIIVFVVACLVIIPMSVSRLQTLLGLQSPYRRPYIGNEGDEHIVVCGHVNDVGKLGRFFKEFFHEDRLTEVEYHAVILSPQEPTEEVRGLLSGSLFGSRVSYVIGTAMATEDLKRAKADSARCMFFLCNTEVKKGTETNEDAATILRSLSVSNFNSKLECLVQVLRPEERVILKDSDVDCILCLDEFKTVLQARNAVCPGFSTFIENIFHSVEDVPEDSPLQKNMAPWYKEYLHGAGMELYFVELNMGFIRLTQFRFNIISDIVYNRFGCISLGMCNKALDSVVFNPTLSDLGNFTSLKEFYRTYNVLVIMAEDQYQADSIGKAMRENFGPKDIGFELIETYKMNDWNEDDLDSDDEDDDADESYIGFANFDQGGDKEETSPDFPETSIIKGPSVSHLPHPPKPGVPKKKIRLVPAVQSAIDASERRLLGAQFAPIPTVLGQPSATLKDASNLRNHVVVFGCDTYLSMFISELRRPAVSGESYHPIVIIAEEEPAGWGQVLEKYNDLYYVKASMNKHTVSSKANLNHAFSLIFLAPRDQFAHDDENKDNIDAVALFAFLKLEQLIPSNVFCSIELNSSGNMAVLNATIMKRARRLELDAQRKDLRRKLKEKRARSFDAKMTGKKGASKVSRRESAVTSRRRFSSNNNTGFSNDVIEDEENQLIEESNRAGQSEKVLWEAIDTHHIFPVYASARVFVPSSFETLLVQSFYVKLTPVICERFICGQLSQTVQQVTMPERLVGRTFLEVFRAFSCSSVIALGLYRALRKEAGAFLPYVFNAPPPDSIMYTGDKIFLFGSTKRVEEAVAKVRNELYGI